MSVNFYRNRVVSSGSLPQINTGRTGAVEGNDQYTKLLLHFDGVEDSTAILDSSLANHAVQNFGTVSQAVFIDSAQSVYGGFSGLFNGTTSYVSVPDSDDWNMGSGDFTIDFRIRDDTLPTGTTSHFIVSQYNAVGTQWYLRILSRAGVPISITVNAPGANYVAGDELTIVQGAATTCTMKVDSIDGGGGVTGASIGGSNAAIGGYSVAGATTAGGSGDGNCTINITAIAAHTLHLYSIGGGLTINHNRGWAIAADTWYHVAIVRYGNIFSSYINGTLLVSSTTDVDAFADVSGTLKIGQLEAANWFVGWIDEFRISKDIARWTANFTPPTQAYA